MRLLAAALLALLPGLGQAQGLRGEVEWRYDPSAASQEARKTGKPLLLYFASERSPACHALSEVLADEAVVRATQGLVPVFVDCSLRSAPRDLQEAQRVGGVYPTLVFLDPAGAELERVTDPAKVREALLRVSQLRRGLFGGLTLTEGNDQALGEGKLLALLFTDERPATRKRTQALIETLEGLTAIQPRFVWVRRSLRDGKRPTAEAKRLGVSRAPTLLLLEPSSKPPSKKRVLARYTAAKDLQLELERFLKKRDEEAEDD